MGLSGLEPPTSRLSGVRSNRLSYKPVHDSFQIPVLGLQSADCSEKYHSGDKGVRTLDPLLARQVLSQLSYTPIL